MNPQIETALRAPESYDLAHRAIESMRAVNVWPTPLNFELWVHYLGAPDSPLGQEMARLLASITPFTEATSEMLAAEFLPRSRLSEEIRDAGAVLNRELTAVQEAIDKARQIQIQYGETLKDAADRFEADEPTSRWTDVVNVLAQATRRIQRHTNILERRLASSHSEVSKLRDHLEQVRRDAMTDALTNLANRKAFDERMHGLFAEADANETALGLAVIDIDQFKRFNDTWGHQTGDQVLRYVAASLARISFEPRMAARYGGEEFAMLFPGEQAAAVESTLNNLRMEISSRALRRRSTNDDLGVVTISAGFAMRQPNETTLQLMERADRALYASKNSGRNRVTSAEEPLSDAA